MRIRFTITTAAVACLLGISASASAQQNPSIQLPNVPGVTQPLIPQGQPSTNQPYGNQQQNPNYRGSSSQGGSRCAELASQERQIRGDLENARSGQDRDHLQGQLGQIQNEQGQQNCR